MTELPQDRHIQELLSVAEAAKEIGISEQAVRKAAAKGQILGKKVGGSTWVFRPAVVKRAKERRQRDPEQ